MDSSQILFVFLFCSVLFVCFFFLTKTNDYEVEVRKTAKSNWTEWRCIELKTFIAWIKSNLVATLAVLEIEYSNVFSLSRRKPLPSLKEVRLRILSMEKWNRNLCTRRTWRRSRIAMRTLQPIRKSPNIRRNSKNQRRLLSKSRRIRAAGKKLRRRSLISWTLRDLRPLLPRVSFSTLLQWLWNTLKWTKRFLECLRSVTWWAFRILLIFSLCWKRYNVDTAEESLVTAAKEKQLNKPHEFATENWLSGNKEEVHQVLWLAANDGFYNVQSSSLLISLETFCWFISSLRASSPVAPGDAGLGQLRGRACSLGNLFHVLLPRFLLEFSWWKWLWNWSLLASKSIARTSGICLTAQLLFLVYWIWRWPTPKPSKAQDWVYFERSDW